jgi:hypothetical protein
MPDPATADETPREYTTDEAREKFLAHVRALVDWWADESRVTDPREKLSGLAFSILSALDGCAGGLPGYIVSPAPHPEDEAYLKAEGQNWYPAAPKVECDIAGSLHELFYKK